MSAFTDWRDKAVAGITGRYTKKKGGTDYSRIARDVGAAAAIGTPRGREFLLGKEGGFDRYNVDPNFQTYQEGLRRTTLALEDPGRNPFFQAAMKRAGRFHPGGGRDRAFAMASLQGAGAARQAFGGAYTQAAPIVTRTAPTTGALPYLTEAYGRFRGAKEGAKSQGVQTQGPGFDLNSFLQAYPNLFREPAPVGEGQSPVLSESQRLRDELGLR